MKKKFVVIFLSRMLSITIKFLHTVRNKMEKDHDKWLKNKKVIQSQRMSKNSKFLF